jgi:hypothetical protein
MPVSRPGIWAGPIPADASLRGSPAACWAFETVGDSARALTGKLGSPLRDPESPATGSQVRYRRRSCRGNDAPPSLKVTHCGSRRS